MRKHEQYDLWLHENSELSKMLESKIKLRETIHEWPNSCVQKIILDDDRSFIYKYQSGGIIESLFYKNVTSQILPEVKTLWEDSWYSCMIMEYLDAPTLGQLKLPDSELLKISSDIIEAIQSIRGDFPVLLDLASYSKWIGIVQLTIIFLREFIKNGRQYGSGMKDIDFIEKIVLSPKIKSFYRTRIGLIHGDLNGGNIFLISDKLKLIDWQSCKIAPVELDQASFLSRHGKDPSKYVSKEATNMLYFIGIWWLIKCQTEIMPNENFDERITYFINLLKSIND